MTEQIFYHANGKGIIRPFSSSANVTHRSYSLNLERAITDFGADYPFLQVQGKIKEHYHITVPESAGYKITLSHAQNIEEMQENEKIDTSIKAAETTIAEVDGCMIPIVTPDEEQKDKRKKKALSYREVRLCMAHAKDDDNPVFSAAISSTEETGENLEQCVKKVGFDEKTFVHAVGDGASWINTQIKNRFGEQGAYLIDFYHMCEYLSAASLTCSPDNSKKWYEEQKLLLKNNDYDRVLENLAPNIEDKSVVDDKAPVRACHRYIKNREDQLDYKSAIENGLPIGSGEIESAHQYVIQERLKIQGAWWRVHNVQSMLALRTNVANSEWNNYWGEIA